MSEKATNILAYCTWIGWLIAFLAGDKENCKFHLNQGLVLMLSGLVIGFVGVIPVIGWIVSCVGSVAIIVFVIMGIISACKDEEKPLPLIGQIKLLK